MEMKDKIAVIADILDVEEELTADTVLGDMDEWDSITKLSLLIYFDENTDKELTADEIKKFETVNDILVLMD